MKDLVSIVFTSYNHKEYLKQALDSLISQTYKQIEIIIVDDCSTDGSQQIIEQYRDFPHVQIHLQEVNSGSYIKASNYGAAQAQGEYLLFAQCDDYAEPDQVEKLIKAINEKQGIGVAFSRSRMIDKDGALISDDFAGREKKFRDKCNADSYLSGAEMRDFLSYSCVIPNLSAALIRRDLYSKSGGLSEKFLVAGDWALWLELSEITNFYYLIECLNNFRQHATTIRSSIKIKTQILEIYNIFYNHIYRYHLKGKNKRTMQIGAGAIWFWYFINNQKQWLLSFPSVIKAIRKYEKLNLVYLASGAIKQIKEVYKKNK